MSVQFCMNSEHPTNCDWIIQETAYYSIFYLNQIDIQIKSTVETSDGWSSIYKSLVPERKGFNVMYII